MKKQRTTIMLWSIRTLTIIMACSLFFLLLGSQLALADEGGKIAFCKDMDNKFQIVVTDESGKNMQILSKNHRGDDYEPSWSFDGKHIAFVSDRNGNGTNICIMDADGSNQYQVTKNEVWEFSPSFSPSGKNLVFTRSTDYSHAPNAQIHFKIYTIDIDGSNEKYLTDGYGAKWSSDGKEIVFCKESNIIIMDSDGKNQVQIAKKMKGTYPSWSLDGKDIAFTSDDGNSNEIYKMDSDGKNIVCLTKGMTNAVNPSWSPDGEHIVFWDMTTYNIYKVSADGGNSVLISDGTCMEPSWFDPAFARQYAVDLSGKYTATWGWIKNR